MRPNPKTPGPGQESVWDYPRPPRLERTHKELKVIFNGQVIARTTRGYRVLETSHPPTYYFPPEDVNQEFIEPASGSSFCEFKGRAAYFDVVVEGQRARRAAWTYPRPTETYAPIAGYFCFYPAPMDQCTVNGETVTPQPGGFYGGWITDDVVGPFKGEPGTSGW